MEVLEVEHTEKEIVGVRTEATDLEDLKHVKELTVDVADHCYWR